MDQEKPQTPGKERTSLGDFFREAWSLALLKVGTAEDEANRILQRAAEVAGWGEDEAKRLAKEFGERLAAQRKEFEGSVEEGVDRAVSRLKVARRDEVEAMTKRLDRVEARIEALRTGRQS
jgi:polyhydroxyalkanoate synthesis regulator phasin